MPLDTGPLHWGQWLWAWLRCMTADTRAKARAKRLIEGKVCIRIKRDVFNVDALKKDMVTRNSVDFPQIDTRSPLHHSKQMHLAPSKVHHPMAGWAASLRCLLVCLWLGLPTALSAQSHHWRGPHQNGFFPDGSLSGQLDASSMNWKVAVPGKGTSTPVVTKDWIVLTYAHEGQNTVAAYRRNGEPGWIALCGAEAPGKHRNGSGSNASIATDGDHFFAYFKSGHWVGLRPPGPNTGNIISSSSTARYPSIGTTEPLR